MSQISKMAIKIPNTPLGERIGVLQADFSNRGLSNSWVHHQKKHCAQMDETPLHIGEDLIIGRLEDNSENTRSFSNSKATSTWCFDDRSISERHLKIYSVQYDDSHSLAPLVYAEDLSSNGTQLNRVFISGEHRTVLLSDGDRIRLSKNVSLVWRTQRELRRSVTKLISQNILDASKYFESQFHFHPVRIGVGAFGDVMLAMHLPTKKQVACKIVDVQTAKYQSDVSAKSGWPPDKRIEKKVSKAFREVDILKDLNHELVVGGDLMSRLDAAGGHLNEGEAAVIIKQLLEAIQYLHQKEIIHRDIKPENILLSSRSHNPRVVLADFGHAVALRSSGESRPLRARSIAGTYGFTAPEVYRQAKPGMHRGYTKAVDMWSMGCLAYVLLVGHHPFGFQPDGKPDSSRFRSSGSDVSPPSSPSLTAPQSIWAGVSVSSRARDFIQSLLVVNEDNRLTVEDALAHHWLTNETVKDVLEKVCGRAVAGWHARGPWPNLVEEMPLAAFCNGKLVARRSSSSLPKCKPIPPRSSNPLRSMLDRVHRPAGPTAGAKRSRPLDFDSLNLRDKDAIKQKPKNAKKKVIEVKHKGRLRFLCVDGTLSASPVTPLVLDTWPRDKQEGKKDVASLGVMKSGTLEAWESNKVHPLLPSSSPSKVYVPEEKSFLGPSPLPAAHTPPPPLPPLPTSPRPVRLSYSAPARCQSSSRMEVDN